FATRVRDGTDRFLPSEFHGMNSRCQQIAVMGSTGSIGCSTLEVAAAAPQEMQVVALSAHGNFDRLVEQAGEFRPKWVIATDEVAAADYDWSKLPGETELLLGAEGVRQAATDPAIDVVVA